METENTLAFLTTTLVETTPEDAGRRIDTVLADELDGQTRSTLQRHIEQGRVLVNGKIVRKNYRVEPGDIILCQIPQPVPYEAAAEPIPLEVVYEDGDIIVINKPRGMVVHPAPGHYTGTVVNALLYHCGASLSGVNGTLRPGIVHRIDKDTSGLLVAAKNDRAHQLLAAQLAAHTMRRTYHAVVYNNIKEDRLRLDAPIGRHPVDRKRMAVLSDGRGKSRTAITHVTVLERYSSFTLIEARLETGRTHQIRVHLSHAGYPLLGDSLYGADKQPYGLTGQVLHAKSLGFTHPVTGLPMDFDSEWPPYFAEAVEKLRKRG